jgi:phosphoribosylaminoimidazole carboxylase (NCAIR synthetase)
VHLYGKTAMRPGRKMGHVTRVFADKGTPGSPRGSG